MNDTTPPRDWTCVNCGLPQSECNYFANNDYCCSMCSHLPVPDHDTTEAEALAPNETAAIITPSTVEAGTHCTFCSATYAKCTEDVLREMHDPKSNDGCCDECRDSSGHQTRSLPLVAALVARTVAARDAEQRAEAWDEGHDACPNGCGRWGDCVPNPYAIGGAQ